MKLTLLTLIFTISVGSAWGQIAQSHPEYCGLPENANPPLPDITASVDPNGRSVLYVGHGSTAIALTLPDYYMSEISQVCPLPDERMVVFAQMPPNVTVLYVVAHASIVDSLWVYHPVISPNQRWIAFTKWYPYYVQGSGEIMLYDLSKTPAQNQPPADSVHPNDPKIDAGTIIFPPGHENFAGSNIVDTPPDQIIHDVGTLHWALDSRAIVFKDVVDKDAGIAVVKLDERGNPSVFRRALTRADICGRGTPTTNASAWALNEAEDVLRAELVLDVGVDAAQIGGLLDVIRVAAGLAAELRQLVAHIDLRRVDADADRVDRHRGAARVLERLIE